MKRYVYLLIPITGLILVGFWSCKAKKTAASDCPTFLVSYNAHVKPILDANCASGCHSAKNRAGKIDLSNYESVKAIATEARFLGAVRHLAGFDAMPPGGAKLSDSSIQILNCWIKNGSPQ